MRFCTHLRGKESWFLPFNKGWNDGRGNPPNPNGLNTDYLWKEVLTRNSLTNIIENYAQIVETKDDKTGRKRRTQICPRYHQLEVVRSLLADVPNRGVGGRYLIQHSAGSGKSNSIAWLAHQLVGLERDGSALFDTVIVVTDRRVLDQQIRDTIRQFAQVRSVVGHAETSGHLRALLRDGKKIVITTIQKFPFILDAIGNGHRGRRFAIVIDEAHSSQGGRTSASVSAALADTAAAAGKWSATTAPDLPRSTIRTGWSLRWGRRCISALARRWVMSTQANFKTPPGQEGPPQLRQFGGGGYTAQRGHESALSARGTESFSMNGNP